jgi:hypothetical protein
LVRPVATAQFEDVAEALGGDEARFGAAPLKHHVGGDGGAMDDLVDLPHQVIAECHEPVHQALGLVVGGGRHLRDPDRAGFRVDRDQIGEGAADINADGPAFAGRVAHVSGR